MRANKTRAGLLVCLCFLLILGSCKEEEDAVLNLSMSEITFGSKSEVKSVEVYANTSWSAEIALSFLILDQSECCLRKIRNICDTDYFDGKRYARRTYRRDHFPREFDVTDFESHPREKRNFRASL